MRALMSQEGLPMAVLPTIDEGRVYYNPFFLRSFASESDSDDDQFDFGFSNELLLDPNDVVRGEMIGEGSSSIVYKGLFRNQYPVAVKVMQPSRTADASREWKEKFQKEVLLLSKIKHDSIVKFVGVCIEPELMVVTELLEGGPLRRFMNNSRPHPFDLKMSLSYALDIAMGMEYLHSNGIIHRDLKPQNILVTGDATKVKLADFGTAREESTDCMTSEAGTYRYMAPEVIGREPLRIGEKLHYDHKIDVYSFAILFWEIVTNEIPFHGRSSYLIPYFVISQNERPSLENIPSGVAQLLEVCWAQDPRERPGFKEITAYLRYLLSVLCPNDNVSMTSSMQANVDVMEDVGRGARVQGCDFHVKKPKEKKKMKKFKKKVLDMILHPLFKKFRACFYK